MRKEGQSKGLKTEIDDGYTNGMGAIKKERKKKFRHRNLTQRTGLRVLPSRASACS